MSVNVLLLIVLVLLTVAVWQWSRRIQRQTGLPPGDVIYTDSGAWFPNDTPLHAADLRLIGKPDYLVEQANGEIIPVELKSGKAPSAPHEGHVLQLAAYCLLVEENYGIRPTIGILQYQDRAFAIDYSEELEMDLLDLLADMRADMFEGELDRDHNDWRRCSRCGMRHDCYQRMA